MSYSSLRACVNDLEKHGQLLRIKKEVDPNLEMAEIHRRIFDEGGPAILFEKISFVKIHSALPYFSTLTKNPLYSHFL